MLKPGDKFNSFNQFSIKLKEYEKYVLNEFWIRDSRTLKTQSRKFPDSVAAKADYALKYYYLRIACLKGGRMHEFKNITRQTVSYKEGCQAGMFLKLSTCGLYLEIHEINEIHNHNTLLPKLKMLLRKKKNLHDKKNVLSEENLIYKNDESNENTISKFIGDISLPYVRRKPRAMFTESNGLEIRKVKNMKVIGLTSSKKFDLMNSECLKLTKICSKVSPKVFFKRLKLIKKLVEKWSSDEEKFLSGTKQGILCTENSNSVHNDGTRTTNINKYSEYNAETSELNNENREHNSELDNSGYIMEQEQKNIIEHNSSNANVTHHVILEHNYFKPHQGFDVIFIDAENMVNINLLP